MVTSSSEKSKRIFRASDDAAKSDCLKGVGVSVGVIFEISVYDALYCIFFADGQKFLRRLKTRLVRFTLLVLYDSS